MALSFVRKHVSRQGVGILNKFCKLSISPMVSNFSNSLYFKLSNIVSTFECEAPNLPRH
jgi:hypothetical protein